MTVIGVTLHTHLVERKQNITANLSHQQILQDQHLFAAMTVKLKYTPKDAYHKQQSVCIQELVLKLYTQVVVYEQATLTDLARIVRAMKG